MEKTAEKFRSYWLIVVVISSILIVCTFHTPAYSFMQWFSKTTYMGEALVWWLNHPFSAVVPERIVAESSLHGDTRWLGYAPSHCDKLVFRVTLPLLNQVLRQGLLTLMLASQVAAIFILVLVYKLLVRHTQDVVSASYATWAFAACYAGRNGFYDFMFGDAVAVALLLGAMYVQRPWMVVPMLLAAAFTDERALTATPLVILYSFWKEDTLRGVFPGRHYFWVFWKSCWPALVAILTYFILRVAITQVENLHLGTSQITLSNVISNYENSLPALFVDSFGGFWLVPILYILCLIAAQGWKSSSAWLYFSLMALATVPAFLVADFERSLCYLFPGMVMAACFLPFRRDDRRTLFAVVLAISVLWSIPGSRIAFYPEHIVIRLYHDTKGLL
ncbi:MAG: hypothetical protein WCG31_11275 [Deltaproteobacteria bacterium]